MVKMFLKYETTLNVYEHKNEKILCRVKVLPLICCSNASGNNPNTCRSMSADQWNEFDKELQSWLVLNEINVSKEKELLCRFSVKPNLQVNVRRSNLIIKDFLNCVNNGDDVGIDELDDFKNFSCVLDCLLEYTSMPLTPSQTTDEYEPLPTTSIYSTTITSPLPYIPYTPSKRKRRFQSEYQVKAPCFDILGYEAVEETYSPKPVGAISSTADIAHYNPAPIDKMETLLESEESNLNEVIIDTEDERLPYQKYRSIRTRLNSKSRKYKNVGEYVPQTQLVESNIPAYNPTPIDVTPKVEEEPKNDKEVPEEQQENTVSPKKEKSEIKRSTDHKKRARPKSKENVIENEKGNKRSSEETKSTSSEKTKQNLNSTFSSEDEFQTAYHKEDGQYKNKDNRKTEDTEGLAKIEKRLESQKESLKSATKIKKENLLASGDELDTNTHKRQLQDKDNKKKDKDKDTRRPKHQNEEIKANGNKSSQRESVSSSKDRQGKVSPSSVRRSVRSPSKPRRFIEEQEQERCNSRHKIKPERLSPIKNKELFGTDDDDEDTVAKCSDSNNNGSNTYSVFQTPTSDNRNTSLLTLSASPTSTSKKKRKRDDCEQEKAGMSKWLGKKGSGNGRSGGDTTAPSSKEKSSTSKDKSSSSKDKSSSSRDKSSSSRDKSSSSKDKSSSSKEKYSSSKEKSSSSKDKSSKSSKQEKVERCKSVSPLPMDIVMPSREELEVMRNKHKMQREENEKVKAALEKINIPAPKEVEQLSLKDMTLNELLDSFSVYRKDLDEIFEKNRNKDHVKGNDGINHCLVIGLIDQRLQFKMLKKLSDVYNSTNTTHATLYANAILPEWIVRIFMEKYKFSRHQAIEHIEDQDAYRSYIDGQNENSLIFED